MSRGAFAEYVCASESKLAMKPDKVTAAFLAAAVRLRRYREPI